MLTGKSKGTPVFNKKGKKIDGRRKSDNNS